MLDEAIQDWIRYCRRNYEPRTVGHYTQVIMEFNKFLGQDGKKLTSQAIEAYIDRLFQRAKRRTCNAHLSAIKSFCRWCSTHRNCDNPSTKVPLLKEDPPNQRVITKEEYRELLTAAQGIDRDIIQFVGNTGLRRNEFQYLKWSNISPDLKLIKLTGKGRKRRVIPLNDVCQGILSRFVRDNDNNYIPLNRRYPGREGLYWLCKKLSRKTGVAQFGPHGLRHFFATRLLANGVSIYKVSQILGHASVKTTEKIYAHLILEDFLGVTDCLNF